MPAASVLPFSRAGSPPELPAATRRSFVDTAEGRRVAFVEAGSGPAAVLVHGTLTTADDMRLGPMPALARSFRCVAFDRPGHGWSDHRPGADASLWDQMEILRGAVRALGLERPVICGHSFGGAVALAYALAHGDEIAGAVALAPICFPELRLEHLLFGPRAVPPFGGLLSDALAPTFDRAVLPALWRAMFLPQAMPDAFAAEFPFGRAGGPGQLAGEGENAAALWPDLALSALRYASCRAPVRILAGTADIVVNGLIHAVPAAATIPGARLDWLPGTGHMLHHFRADAVAAAVAELAEG